MRHDRRTILPVALALAAGFVAGLALGLSTDEIAVLPYPPRETFVFCSMAE